MSLVQFLGACLVASGLVLAFLVGWNCPRTPTPQEAAKVLGRAGRAKQLQAARKRIDQTTAELRAIVGK